MFLRSVPKHHDHLVPNLHHRAIHLRTCPILVLHCQTSDRIRILILPLQGLAIYLHQEANMPPTKAFRSIYSHMLPTAYLNSHPVQDLSPYSILPHINDSQGQFSRTRSRPWCTPHSNKEVTFPLLGSLHIYLSIRSQASRHHRAASCFLLFRWRRKTRHDRSNKLHTWLHNIRFRRP